MIYYIQTPNPNNCNYCEDCNSSSLVIDGMLYALITLVAVFLITKRNLRRYKKK